MKSKFKKLLATALVLCLVLALLPAAAFAEGVDLNVTYKNFEQQEIQASSEEGSVSISKVDDNEGKYTITAKPGTNYGLKAIKVVDSDNNALLDKRPFSKESSISYDFNATANSNITVYVGFAELYSVNVSSLTGGSITASPSTAFDTEQITLTVEPQEGYILKSGTLTVKDENNSDVSFENFKFTMPASNVTVSAEFEQKEAQTYTITCPQNTTTDNGYVSTSPSNTATEGQTVNVFAYGNPGYVATKITVYESGTTVTPVKIITGSSGSFKMPAHDVTVQATFEEIETPTTEHYIVCADKITGGEIWPSANSAKAGDTVYIKVDPDWGWMTDDVYYKTTPDAGLIGGKASFNGYAANGDEIWTFKMPASNVWVYAEFKPYFPGHGYHAINVTSDGHCSVDVKNWAYCGEDVTINLSNFDTGYAFSYLKVDGECVTPYGFNGYLSYTFTMPHKDVAIEVGTTSVSGKYYIDTSYDSTLGGVEVWVNNNYVNNWHQGSWADYNDTVSFKVKPYYSDDVVSVSVVGKRTGWTYSYDYNSYSGWYTFTMPNEDVTINVDFRSGVHKVYVDKVTDGKLTVSDDWAKYGQIVYITAVPDYGCTLSSLSVRTATGDSVHVYNAQKADTYYFYMPDQYVSVSAVFTGKYTSLPFNDVSYGDWYYDAVQFVYSKGIMDGVDYYKFAPNGTITRGMIVTMLWRMAGEPFEMPVTSFTDVEIGRYYTTAVAWACRNGIADGMGESTFGPNDAITREELVTLLYRYAQYFGHSCIGTSIEGFADAGSVSSYAYNAMCWAYKAGVVTGTTGSRLNPQGTASRAEAAQMIMSFYSFLNS